MTPRTLIATLALLALCSSPAFGEGRKPIRGHNFLPEARWGRLAQSDIGKKFYLEGRWHEIYGNGIRIFMAKDTRGFIRVQNGPLKDDRLVKDRDMTGEVLQKGVSVVRVFGVAQKGRKVWLDIQEVRKLPDEDQQFQAKLATLGNEADEIMELADECAERAERYDDPRLWDMVTRITKRELDVRHKSLQPADWKGRLRLAERYLRSRGQMDGAVQGAIQLYAELVEDPKAPKEFKRDALGELRKLEAIRIRQGDQWTWVPYDIFKTTEGFLKRDDRWVRREWAELEDIREEELEKWKDGVAMIRVDEAKCKSEAKAKRLTRGQKYAEARMAAGLPISVNHWKAPLQIGRETVWTQWILRDGRRAYFVYGERGGELISTVPASQGWPSD